MIMQKTVELDDVDRLVINQLQGGFPISSSPFCDIAKRLDMDEDALIKRVQSLLDRRVLSRFGPLYNAEVMGGGVTLAAIKVPQDSFEEVNKIVNSFPEVAHNYERTHALNMWFVVLCEYDKDLPDVLARISEATGLEVLNMPKEEEYFLELKLNV